MQHLMIDLETAGKRFDAPVLSIGAVFFEPESGELGRKFYARIDPVDAFRFGRPCGDTFRWWMRDPSISDEARKHVVGGTHKADEVLEKFVEFINAEGVSVKPWGNGATFDITIIDYWFQRVSGKLPPWDFWNVRDCRTIKDAAHGLAEVPRFAAGVQHHALDDAVHQAKWISTMWQVLRGSKQPAPSKAFTPDDLLS